MRSKHAASTGLAALALTAALGMAGCSDAGSMGGMDHGSSRSPSAAASPSASTSASVSAEFNDADVQFAQMMVPHHEQAVTMSDTLLAKSGVNPEVAALAEEVKAAQQPEIDTMKGWLSAWGQEQPGGGMGGMHHGGGMATEAELEEFEAADGETGQRMYLEMMTAHHEGAIRMAQGEVSRGRNPEAVKLAKDIIATQQQEITVMGELLSKL